MNLLPSAERLQIAASLSLAGCSTLVAPFATGWSYFQVATVTCNTA
jgi:hypothetical protein